MSKILFLADLHGNYTATLAMEKEIQKINPDEIWFLGDAVGKGPENDKTCDWVRTHCNHCISGNWDIGVYEGYRDPAKAFPDTSFYISQLGEERIAWLESLPREAEILISGIRFRVIHGRPVDKLFWDIDDEEKLTQGILSSTPEKHFEGLICADSHRPFIRSIKSGYVMNTGSIGNSLGIPNAHALLIEGDLNETKKTPFKTTFLCVPYDNQKAARIAENCEAMPLKEAYIAEILTGVYSR